MPGQLLMSCSPRLMTPRTADLPTLGPKVARMARLVGRPLIPWQRAFADVALELRPDGRLLHRYVVAVVPRRAGKSLLMMATGLAITEHRRFSRAFYTSHRRETAAALWRDEWYPLIEGSPLTPHHLQLRTANGSEAMAWRKRHSTMRLLPPAGDAIRSASSNLAFIDEAREVTPDQGAEIEAAVLPTQATGWGGQTWIVSNAGTSESVWLRGWLERARAGVARGDPSIAVVEYAAPDDADPDDPATWMAAHPGLGHHVHLDVLMADHAIMDPATFGCEYLGIWPDSLTDRPLLDGWAATEASAVALTDPVVLSFEVDPDRELTSIVAVGRGAAGGVAVEILEHGPHGRWVVPRLRELCDRWSPLALVWDRGSPANALAPDLDEINAELVALDAAAVAGAAGAFHDAVLALEVHHLPDPILTAAITAARRRTLAGGWTFDRRVAGSGPLLAATFAAWLWRDGTRRPPAVA